MTEGFDALGHPAPAAVGRGHGGVHVASASDYEAEKYVRNLIG